MGMALGNELDMPGHIGGEHDWRNPGCRQRVWDHGGYLQTYIDRVTAFDAVPGMPPNLPITGVFSHMGWMKDYTEKLVRSVREHYGTRFAFTVNVYAQYSSGLAQAGCHKATEVGSSFNYSGDVKGFVPAQVDYIRKWLDGKGWQDMQLWIGETGWCTQCRCELRCNEACRSIQTQKEFYMDFLKWDMTAGSLKADHVFYFTARDSSVFGSSEEFGLMKDCHSDKCKFQF
jgi:hypothetical protein